MALPTFVRGSRFKNSGDPPLRSAPLRSEPTQTLDGSFDHSALANVVGVVVRNLNKVLEINHYPVPQARYSSLKHRPIGIGVQGLADVFHMLKLPYESEAAQQLNVEIFETMYYAALDASCAEAERLGPYESYEGSPTSQGILQFDMWGVQPKSGRWDWVGLKARIAQHGLRNSLLTALMPTAGTSQILGNTESFEPMTNNIYIRTTLAGEFVVVNGHLMQDMMDKGLWTPEMRKQILAANGSIEGILEIPEDMRELYKTVWEISAPTIVKMSADRAPYIDQSQSLNLHMRNVTETKLTSYHFRTWKMGLKTGMYYLRMRQTLDAQKATLEPTLLAASLETLPTADSPSPPPTEAACSRRPKGLSANEACFSCSS